MAKYRKRSGVIKAVQLRWDTWSEMHEFVGEAWDQGFSGCYLDKHNQPLPEGITSEIMGLLIPTPEGVIVGRQGDYIIKGVMGEFYPCKPNIFEATYEEVK